MLDALAVILDAITNIFANLFSALLIFKDSLGLLLEVHTYFPSVLSVSFWIFISIMSFNYILGR